MDHILLSLREDEFQEFEELLSEVHELVDPDLDLSQLLGTVHDRAVATFRNGSIEPGALRGLLHDMIAGDVVEENRSQLPEDPTLGDLMPLVDEIDRRLAGVSRDGKQLVYRALLLRALQDWREFGILVFADRWLM